MTSRTPCFTSHRMTPRGRRARSSRSTAESWRSGRLPGGAIHADAARRPPPTCGRHASPPPIATLIGFTLTAVSPGEAVIELVADRQHANPMGALHGGVLCDIADAAMGIAYASTLAEGETFATIELKINFLKPVWTAEGPGGFHRSGRATLEDDFQQCSAREARYARRDRQGRGVSRIGRQQLHHGNGFVCGWRHGASVGRYSPRERARQLSSMDLPSVACPTPCSGRSRIVTKKVLSERVSIGRRRRDGWPR